MTAIAIWLNNEKPYSSLWVASDSRISSTEHSSPLIDDAAKIFTLPVVCRVRGGDGYFSQISYYHTYGYCFAGSTLLGQNVFLALMPLLSNLAAFQPYAPAMADVASFISEYLGRAFDNYKVIACGKAAVEVALFGWCHVTRKYHIFHYYPQKDDNSTYSIRFTDYTDLDEKSFVYLGDYKNQIQEKIQEAFNGNSELGRPLSRIPRYIIEECIQDSEYKTIGGDLQLGAANQFGFRPFFIGRLRVPGKTGVSLSYLGYELCQDIKTVGHAFIDLSGMS